MASNETDQEKVLFKKAERGQWKEWLLHSVKIHPLDEAIQLRTTVTLSRRRQSRVACRNNSFKEMANPCPSRPRRGWSFKDRTVLTTRRVWFGRMRLQCIERD